MAYIKIFGIKFTVKKAVDYITNPDKTDAQNLVSSYGCSPETADLTFAMTAKLGKANVMEKPHEGIREYYESLGSPVPAQGISPLQEWGRDSRPLTFLDTGVIAEAFLHHETRLVDKGACISFQGRKYETKPSLIGCKVEISYDPMSPEVVKVSYPGIPPFEAGPVKIGEFCSKTPALPVSMQACTEQTAGS